MKKTLFTVFFMLFALLLVAQEQTLFSNQQVMGGFGNK